MGKTGALAAGVRNKLTPRLIQALNKYVWRFLPSGGSLPPDVWESRHRFLLRLAWFHALFIALIGPVIGYRWEFTFDALFEDGTVLHTLGEGLVVALFAAAAIWRSNRRAVKATLVGLGLMSSSAILVHLSGGYIELHFHFFVMVAFMALYQDWIPYLLAILYVAIHHGAVGVLWPEGVYNHAAAVNAPWTWAGIHAFFVLSASGGSVIAWRFNERAFARTKLILDSAAEGIYGLDRAGKVTFMNPAAAAMLGLGPKEAIGNALRQLLRHTRADGSAFSDPMSPILAPARDGLKRQATDELFWRMDGTNFLVEYTSTPVFERDELTGAVVTFRDIKRRKQAEEELQRRSKELAIVDEMSQMTMKSGDLEAVLAKILDRALSFVSLDLGNIRLFELGEGVPIAVYRGYRDPESAREYDAEVNSAAGNDQITAPEKSLVIEDITACKGLRSFMQEGVRSAVVVPITAQEEKLGVLAVGSRSPLRFRATDVRLLESIGNQVGIAVQKARLLEETSRRAQEQAALNVIANGISQSLHLDELLQIVVEKVLEVTKRERVSIRLKNADTGEVTLAAHRGFSPEEVQELLRRRSHAISEEVFATGQSVIINNPAESKHPQVLLPQSLSVAWIPIKAGMRVVGVLGVSAGRSIPFEPREIELLQAIGNMIGVALENARLFQETERRNRELQSLYTVTSAVTQSLDLENLMQVALRTMIDVLDVDAGLLYIQDEKNNTLRLTAHHGIPVDQLSGIESYVPSQGIIGKIFVEKRPVAFADIASDPSYHIAARGGKGRNWGFRSAAGLPITVRLRPVGVIYVYGRTVRQFSPHDIELLSALGRQIGFAIENARLFSETESRYEELRTLHDIGQTILDSLQIDVMMEQILNRALEIGRFDIGLVRLLDATSETYSVVAGRGYRDAKNIERHRKQLDGFRTGISTPRLMVDKAVQVIDLAQTQGMQTFRREGIRTLVAVPLRSHEEVLGVIHLGSRLPREFRDGELRLLDAIGGQAGIAAQKARLYEESQQARSALAQKAEELARSNGDLQHFAYVASHDLQEPLRMVGSYMQLLARRYKGKLDSTADEFIDYAIDGAKRMQILIKALLAYSRIGTKGVPFEPTDCEEILRTTLKDLQLAIEDSRAVIASGALPTVMADATQLGQLFQNLIGNAVKFRNGRQPEVHVSAERNGAEWLFSFRDNGIGIDPRYNERIFVIFQRLHNKEEYPGTGIGLALCKKIVERHGGRIWVESEPDKGSNFCFTLPACESV